MTRRLLDGVKKHANDPAAPRRPADWGHVRPTAFPDVGPAGPKELAEFVARRIPQVLESDPPLQRLQKAKLQAAWAYVVLQHEFRVIGDPKVSYETTVASLFEVAREAVATGLEKEFEAFLADRVKAAVVEGPSYAWSARRRRLDAEIALLKHVHESGGKAK